MAVQRPGSQSLQDTYDNLAALEADCVRECAGLERATARMKTLSGKIQSTKAGEAESMRAEWRIHRAEAEYHRDQCLRLSPRLSVLRKTYADQHDDHVRDSLARAAGAIHPGKVKYELQPAARPLML